MQQMAGSFAFFFHHSVFWDSLKILIFDGIDTPPTRPTISVSGRVLYHVTWSSLSVPVTGRDIPVPYAFPPPREQAALPNARRFTKAVLFESRLPPVARRLYIAITTACRIPSGQRITLSGLPSPPRFASRGPLCSGGLPYQHIQLPNAVRIFSAYFTTT